MGLVSRALLVTILAAGAVAGALTVPRSVSAQTDAAPTVTAQSTVTSVGGGSGLLTTVSGLPTRSASGPTGASGPTSDGGQTATQNPSTEPPASLPRSSASAQTTPGLLRQLGLVRTHTSARGTHRLTANDTILVQTYVPRTLAGSWLRPTGPISASTIRRRPGQITTVSQTS